MNERHTYFVTTFYFFKPLGEAAEISKIEADLLKQSELLNLQGLMILGAEGLNATVCSLNQVNLERFKSFIKQSFQAPDLLFKDSVSDVEPFPKFKIKIRPEICTIRGSGFSPTNRNNNHLSPADWHKALQDKENIVILDTRNSYEFRIGTFKRAVNPQIEQFSDFPKFFEDQGFKPDQKVLMFCTGGIRCEKAMVDLQKKGFSQVYQLEGGILNYLEEFPNAEFEGECFVFDNRVAVDQKLQPTRQYKMCPHCGQPAQTKVNCIRCDSPALICPDCSAKAVTGETCSKNCAHHHQLQPGRKGKPQLRPWLKPATP